jgi:hypothetical protein
MRPQLNGGTLGRPEMWPFTVRTTLHGPTGDEAYAKRFGEFLKAEFDARYDGLDVAVGGSQEITTYSFRTGAERLTLELETYIGVTLTASRALTGRILQAARAAGFPETDHVATTDESSTSPNLNAAVFQRALGECDALLARHPDLRVLLSVRDQICFLADVHAGKPVDTSRLADLVLGVQLARQVEPLLSPSTRELFDDIAAYASHLRDRAIAPPQ